MAVTVSVVMRVIVVVRMFVVVREPMVVPVPAVARLAVIVVLRVVMSLGVAVAVPMRGGADRGVRVFAVGPIGSQGGRPVRVAARTVVMALWRPAKPGTQHQRADDEHEQPGDEVQPRIEVVGQDVLRQQ